ncbi:MAG TPA: hypothetical protein VE439_06455 [Anaerolineae bacterium]|nr:hypothetical protein [Anaerolineae bacterium]
MELNPKRRKKVLLVIFGLVSIAIILALIAPEEATLGSYIKLIYIHAAVTWVGMLMFATSGVLALLSMARMLVSRKYKDSSAKDALVDWSSASQSTALHFWATSVLIGSTAAYLTWGPDFWSMEPRLPVALFILVLSFAVYQLGQIVTDKMMRAALNLGLPSFATLLLLVTGKLVHPNNAFAKSGSFEIKLFAGLITLVFIIVAATSTVLFNAKLKRDSAEVELVG